MKVVRLSLKKILFQLFFLSICFVAGWTLKSQSTLSVEEENEEQIPYVVTIKAVEENIAPHKNYIASVEAVNAVDIKAQATGYLQKVEFEEGSFVKQGQRLFVIEQERYYEAQASASAEVERVQANLNQIEKDHKRNLVLFKQKVLTASAIEASESSLAQAKAEVSAAKANLELAKINLRYTEIYSPIDGYIGKALITKGNYIDVAGSPMARIVQASPIRITFSVTDRDRLEVVRLLRNKESYAENIKIVLPDESVVSVKPLKSFFDSEVNSETATVSAYIDVENQDKLLLPGNHVEVVVQTGDNRPAVLIPQTAILQDQQGLFVYTVNTDNRAEKVYVKTGKTENGRTVITDGVKNGMSVVVQGLQKIENGSEVKQTAAE